MDMELVNALMKKMSMADSTVRVRNSLLYTPNYPMDIIQKIIVENSLYWDMQSLVVIDRYLPENPVICDVGANIGSHSVYWGVEKNAKKVYAFEPLPEVFAILQKNIELNNLQDVVVPYNMGLYNIETNASITSYMVQNIGATSFKADSNGRFKFNKLDSIDIPEKVDLLKINVQGAEVEVLWGAAALIMKNKPVITLTSFERRMECEQVLLRFNYKLAETIRPNENYVYIPHESAL